jgi:alkaline phosphatase D
MDCVREAVNRGLPFDRFLVGPRQVLRPLTQLKAFQEYAAPRKIQLAHGPLLGSVTPHGARFWARTIDEVPVQVIVSPDPDLDKPIRSKIRRTAKSSDYTAIVEVTGLQPATTYHYEMLIDGKPALAPSRPYFRTFPTEDSKVRFQVAFGGCAGYNPPCERMWDLIRSYKPEAFLTLGDNVYMDLPAKPNGFVEYTYYRRQSRPEFRRLVSSVPVYAIWDDHDAGMDDVWLGPYKNKPDWKMPLFHNFQQQWNNPAYGALKWPGCWFNFSIGPVEFFMLECRMYRTNPYDKNPTMLGPVQKAWLKKRLKQSKATFKVLTSSVEWTFETKGAARDTWNGFREERKEIFDFLADNRINGVVLLSADRHRTEAYRNERPNGYPLYEFENSRLTNEHVHDLVPGTLFGYNAKQCFALLTFDLPAPDPVLTFQALSIDNEEVGRVEVKLSEISH